MRRALVLCAGVLGVLLLGSPALADVHAVAEPETQTVPINGAAADFDGSDSYTDEEMPISDWAWDFDGDSEDDYTENYLDPWGDGLTTYVYTKAGIFTCRLTVTDVIERQDTDTQEVKVRLTVTSGEINGTSVELLWPNANNVSQFTRYEVHKSTSPGFNPDQNSLVTNITNMATTSYAVTGLEPRTTYYFQVVLVVTGGSLQSNEVEQASGGYHGTKLLYDEAGALTKTEYTDDGGASWQTSSYQYDDVYALTKVTFPDSKTISYFYDKAALRTRMIDPASNVVTYLYDDRGALTKVSVGGSTHGSYFYDDAGRRTRLLYGNSSYASYLYDDANHLTLISNRKSDNNVISSFAYTVDDTGNRTRLTLSNGDYADYVYDDTYQLTREHRKDSGDSTLYYNNFYYDAAGNRTRLEYNDGGGTTTTTYLYNPADQLTRDTVGETNTDYLYDANGNQTKKDDGANVHSYSYDYRNLMTDYDGPGSSNDSTYKYDASGRRITKDVNGTKTAYFHDWHNVVAEYNGSNQLQRTYVTAGLDSNVTMTASGSTYYYLTDALGSIRELIDSNEATQNSYDYYAFGKVYGTPTENLTQPFRFTGRAWDPESSLYYYRRRNYGAGVGRFLTRDSIQLNGLYRYVGNLPTYFIDPWGLWIYVRVAGHSVLVDDTGTGAAYDYFAGSKRWFKYGAETRQEYLENSIWQRRIKLSPEAEQRLREFLDELITKMDRYDELKRKSCLTAEEQQEREDLAEELAPWFDSAHSGIGGINCIDAIARALVWSHVVSYYGPCFPSWGLDTIYNVVPWWLRPPVAGGQNVDFNWFKSWVPGETISGSAPYPQTE